MSALKGIADELAEAVDVADVPRTDIGALLLPTYPCAACASGSS